MEAERGAGSARGHAAGRLRRVCAVSQPGRAEHQLPVWFSWNLPPLASSPSEDTEQVTPLERPAIICLLWPPLSLPEAAL